MAVNANRKKLDEYHLKILREQLSVKGNKYCFDCNQRGPTYINVTIGSFVCTTCSGMLRGLTPPHRVKSISMATFTPEEISSIIAKGNEYCKKVWLGLYDSDIPTKDDQQIKDFMMAKYEKKRYYMDPAQALNRSRTPSSLSSASSGSYNSPVQNGNRQRESINNRQQSRPTTLSTATPNANVNSNNGGQFTASDFSSPVSSAASSSTFDPFCSDSSSSTEASFLANFDDNPAFSSTASTPANTGWPPLSEEDWGVTQSYVVKDLERPSSWGGIPISPQILFNADGTFSGKDAAFSASRKGISNNVPPEDKYAALKDLDFLMKLEKQQPKGDAVANGIGPNIKSGNSNGWSVFSNSQGGIASEPATPFNPFATNLNSWASVENGIFNAFSNGKLETKSNGNWPIQSEFSSQQPVKFPITDGGGGGGGWGDDFANFKVNWAQPNGKQSKNPFL